MRTKGSKDNSEETLESHSRGRWLSPDGTREQAPDPTYRAGRFESRKFMRRIILGRKIIALIGLIPSPPLPLPGVCSRIKNSIFNCPCC